MGRKMVKSLVFWFVVCAISIEVMCIEEKISYIPDVVYRDWFGSKISTAFENGRIEIVVFISNADPDYQVELLCDDTVVDKTKSSSNVKFIVNLTKAVKFGKYKVRFRGDMKDVFTLHYFITQCGNCSSTDLCLFTGTETICGWPLKDWCNVDGIEPQHHLRPCRNSSDNEYGSMCHTYANKTWKDIYYLRSFSCGKSAYISYEHRLRFNEAFKITKNVKTIHFEIECQADASKYRQIQCNLIGSNGTISTYEMKSCTSSHDVHLPDDIFSSTDVWKFACEIDADQSTFMIHALLVGFPYKYTCAELSKKGSKSSKVKCSTKPPLPKVFDVMTTCRSNNTQITVEGLEMDILDDGSNRTCVIKVVYRNPFRPGETVEDEHEVEVLSSVKDDKETGLLSTQTLGIILGLLILLLILIIVGVVIWVVMSNRTKQREETERKRKDSLMEPFVKVHSEMAPSPGHRRGQQNRHVSPSKIDPRAMPLRGSHDQRNPRREAEVPQRQTGPSPHHGTGPSPRQEPGRSPRQETAIPQRHKPGMSPRRH